MAILPGLQWTCDADALVGVQINEIDMVSAGMTVIKLERLLTPSQIKKLEALPKGLVSVVIGKMSRKQEFRGLSDKITQGIRRRVEAMLEYNGITEDRIVSVKRDAVFVTGPTPSGMVLPDGTRFKLKASYTCFAKFGNVEVYCVPRRKTADLKGIAPENRDMHMPFIVRMIMDVLGMMERGDLVEAADTLRQFREDYVSRKLPMGFYREFNSGSSYTARVGRRLFQFDGEADLAPENIDISYNLLNVIVPLARAIA